MGVIVLVAVIVLMATGSPWHALGVWAALALGDLFSGESDKRRRRRERSQGESP